MDEPEQMDGAERNGEERVTGIEPAFSAWELESERSTRESPARASGNRVELHVREAVHAFDGAQMSGLHDSAEQRLRSLRPASQATHAGWHWSRGHFPDRS
jgi:hypothetical protein